MIFWDTKTSAEVDDFSVDWSPRLDGDTVINATCVPLYAGSLAGVTVGLSSYDDTSSTVRLSGGDAGGMAFVIMRVTLSSGRTLDQEVGIGITLP
jgi:hypothetical protein